MRLDAEDIEAIAQRTAELIGQGAQFTEEIMTRAEAMAYAKRNSDAAFSDWCREWHVKPYRRGRYSKTQLDHALQRESRKRAA